MCALRWHAAHLRELRLSTSDRRGSNSIEATAMVTVGLDYVLLSQLSVYLVSLVLVIF